MASPGNPNQLGGGPFDVHKFFKPSSPSGAATTSGNPATLNPQNPNNPNLIASQFPLPSTSYPPSTGGTPGPYLYPPQTSPFHHPPPQFLHHHPHHLQQYSNNSNPPPSQPEALSPFAANLHPQRSLPFATPPLQLPPTSSHHHQFQNLQNPNNINNTSGNNVNSSTNQNPGARLMALLSTPPSTLEPPLQQPAIPMTPIQATSSGGSDFSMLQNLPMMSDGPNVGFAHPGPMRIPSRFEILAFPCNQFGGQEPGSSPEIKQFSCSRFKAEFPIFDKVDVNGPNTAPVYQFLKSSAGGFLGDLVKWNFEKFLVDKSGEVVERYPPTASPFQIEKDIQKLLAA